MPFCTVAVAYVYLRFSGLLVLFIFEVVPSIIVTPSITFFTIICIAAVVNGRQVVACVKSGRACCQRTFCRDKVILYQGAYIFFLHSCYFFNC